jgi:hypothetical protein
MPETHVIWRFAGNLLINKLIPFPYRITEYGCIAIILVSFCRAAHALSEGIFRIVIQRNVLDKKCAKVKAEKVRSFLFATVCYIDMLVDIDVLVDTVGIDMLGIDMLESAEMLEIIFVC